jgi:stage IV sporulation protein B
MWKNLRPSAGENESGGLSEGKEDGYGVKARKSAGLLLFLLTSVMALQPSFQAWLSVPGHLAWEAGRPWRPPVPRGLTVDGEGEPVVRTETHAWRFAGVPVKTALVEPVTSPRVRLGGETIGILLRGGGLVVVGEAAVADADGRRVCPARAAGIRVGDRIVSVDGQEVTRETDVAARVDAAGRRGRALTLGIARRDLRMVRRVRPVYDMEVGRWRIGLFVRDGTSGVGTLTFVDPRSGRWAALGHPVAGRDREPVAAQGAITAATVVRIHSGERGVPGQKLGVLDPTVRLGRVDRNTDVGLMGTVTGDLARGRIVPVAPVAEVHPGPATLWTVLYGQRVEPFRVRIERIVHTARPTSKAFILRVTDGRLIRAAGGIVQGMSGSPITQDGRLVGAVTHVFVNDPTRGFGVFAWWMLEAGGRQAHAGLGRRPEAAAPPRQARACTAIQATAKAVGGPRSQPRRIPRTVGQATVRRPRARPAPAMAATSA